MKCGTCLFRDSFYYFCLRIYRGFFVSRQSQYKSKTWTLTRKWWLICWFLDTHELNKINSSNHSTNSKGTLNIRWELWNPKHISGKELASHERTIGSQRFQDCNVQQQSSIELGETTVKRIQIQWDTSKRSWIKSTSSNLSCDYFRHYFKNAPLFRQLIGKLSGNSKFLASLVCPCAFWGSLDHTPQGCQT